MKILILIGSLACISSVNAQTVFVDDAPFVTKYGLKMQTSSLHKNGDTLYFKIKDAQFKEQSFYAFKSQSTINDSWIYTPYVVDSVKHTTMWLISDSFYRSVEVVANHAMGKVYVSNCCFAVKKEPKTKLINFNVNRIMTSNEISFDFTPTLTAYYPWSITNASGREVASGTLYAHTPSESFKITADNLKAGRYTFTLGEGSDSLNENFSIY